ncbi:MAG: ZIP family metal transporter [Paludibacteraceae bacterium]
MDNIWLYALISTIVVSATSLVGIFLLSFKAKQLDRILIVLISFSAGAMLGNAFFHLLPESYENIKATFTSWLAIGGFLLFFVMERLLHIHISATKSDAKSIKSFGYISLYADSLHNFTDGILIGAAWMFNAEVGLATTIAVILHEIPQEIGDFSILIRAGFSRGKALKFNFLSASTAILGTMLTLWAGKSVSHFSEYILPVAAGGFIFLATNSLLPEIVRETNKKNYWLHLLFILLGLALMYYFSLQGEHVH